MDKLLNILFIIFLLVLLPLGEAARLNVTNTVAVTGIDSGVFVIDVIGIYLFFWKKKRINWRLVKPVFIFISICFISLLINLHQLTGSEFFVSFLYLLRWIGYAGLYFVVMQCSTFLKKRIALYLGIAGGILLFYGYIQYFFYPALRNLYYLGWDEHLYRMFSTFLDPNFFGAFLVLFLLFLVSYIMSRNINSGTSPLRNTVRVKYILTNVLLLFLCLATTIGIVLTYSRSAYSMLIVGLIVFFILKRPNKWIILGIVLIGIVSGVSFFGLTKHSEGTNLLRTVSTQARVGSSEHTLVILQKNPIFGVGFDAYRYAQKRYGFIPKNSVEFDHSGAGSDNSWLFVLATTGIVGFFAYVYVWIKILQGKTKTNTPSTLENTRLHTLRFIDSHTLVVSSSLALFIDCFFINSLFYPVIMAWMWILIGLMENTSL